MKKFIILPAIFFIIIGGKISVAQERLIPPQSAHLEKWNLIDENKKISKALKVFKSKKSIPHSKNFILTNKDNNLEKIYIQYSTFDNDSNLVFSPDEDFVYYQNISDQGDSMIYGIKLETQETFSLGSADSFELTNCPNNNIYVILHNGTHDKKMYSVFDLSGKKVKIFEENMNFENINEKICY